MKYKLNQKTKEQLAKQSLSRPQVQEEMINTPEDCYLHVEVTDISKKRDKLDYELVFSYVHKRTLVDEATYNPNWVTFHFEGDPHSNRIGLSVEVEMFAINPNQAEAALN